MTVVRTLFGDEDHQTAETYEGPTNSSRDGRVAEFLVCAELTRLGYYVTHVDAPGFDVILAVEDASLRVQVKSSTLVTDGYCNWKLALNDRKRRHNGTKVAITKAHADLIALYHHQFGTTIFLPVEGKLKVRLPVSQVKHHVSSDSLSVALKKLGVAQTSSVVEPIVPPSSVWEFIQVDVDLWPVNSGTPTTDDEG
jgi:hypothetical protein